MANFNYRIECVSAEDADTLKDKIESIDIYQDALDVQDEVVSLVSKQGLVDELRRYSFFNFVDMVIEVWAGGLDYDEAIEANAVEIFEYNWTKRFKLG